MEEKNRKIEDDEKQKREDKIKLEIRKRMLREQLEKMKEKRDKSKI